MSKTAKILIGIGVGFVLLIVMLFSWYISTRNTLVEKDEIVTTEVGKMQTQYQRRLDLLDKAYKTAIAESKHERGTFTDVTEARARATQITLDPNNLTEESMRRFQEAQGEISQVLGRLMVADENYPELKASQAWQEVRAQIEGTENRIAVARDNFNEAVQDYNMKVRQFPSSIVASMSGFNVKPKFEADAAAQHAPDLEIPDDI
ncbi:MAG: LemA family protein [Alloprevotella sp.]|nr:LemA family protein [Alloprevotella sp.]MBR1652087.1 LemA family protein [Alloprevotella sp.]